jgi:hypothetical protein
MGQTDWRAARGVTSRKCGLPAGSKSPWSTAGSRSMLLGHTKVRLSGSTLTCAKNLGSSRGAKTVPRLGLLRRRLQFARGLTLGPKEPKARAAGVGHSGDPPEAVVGSLGKHLAAKRANFRDRGVDVVALPEHRPVRQFS